MTEVQPPAAIPTSVQPQPPSKVISWFRGRNRFDRYGRQFLAIIIWAYGLGQLFVFDFDAWLVSWLPEPLRWLVVYKLLTLLLCAALILNFVPRRRFWSWAAYIFLYPLFVIGGFLLLVAWMLMRLKSWTVLFAVLNVTLSFFTRFKANLLIYVIAAIGAVAALVAVRPETLVSACLLLIFAISALVGRRLIAMFRKSPIFNVYVGFMARIMEFSRKRIIKPTSLKDVDVTSLTLAELEKGYGQLSTAVFLSELCRFLESKFKEYRSSNVAIATSLLGLLGLLITVIALLSLANLALYRAQSGSFHVIGGHSLFDFIYYTFGAVTGQRGGEIVPVFVGAKLLSMYAVALELVFVAGTALSLVLSLVRHNEEAGIAEAISRLRKERQRMNEFVEEGFALNFDQAIEVLESLKGGLSVIIKALRAAQEL